MTTMSINNEECLRSCSKGELAVIRDILNPLDRTQIESIRDKYNASCLHYAARSGFVNILEYLIVEKNVSPFLVSEVGASCLHDAAVKGKLNVIEWVVSNTSLNTSFKDSNGSTLIHLAAKFDQLDIIEWILRVEGVKAVKQQTFNGATCVHYAAANNSFRSLRRLLQASPGLVNVQMMNGVTPVYLAAQENNLQLVRYLIRMGANIFLRADDGMNVVHVACQNGNLDMVDLLHRECNASLNDKDYNGATPLHYASINGNPALVAYLLSNGSKIAIDKFGNTPLHDAAVGGYIECARLLIASDCDTIIRDNQNMTSADIAESYGHMEFAKELRKFERASMLKQKITTERRDEKDNTIEELKKQEATSSPTSASNQSVTSPIFNSMAVVTTSTPSSSDKENTVSNSVDLNHTSNSINKNNSGGVNKIDLNAQNSRPKENLLSNYVTTTTVGNSGSSGASTLRLFIKNQDFSVQVDRSEPPNAGSLRGQRFVQSPNGNTFGRSKKSTDLVSSEESRVSALEELDKCIAEFDRDAANNLDLNNNISHNDYSNNKSLTSVSDLSTTQPLNQRDMSLSTFIEQNKTPRSQIMESTGAGVFTSQFEAKNCSSIANGHEEELSFNNQLSPDLNNNDSSIMDANSEAKKEFRSGFTGSRLVSKAPPVPPPPMPPNSLPLTPVNENNFPMDYKNFMLKSAKSYDTERFGKRENSTASTGSEKKFNNYIDELQNTFKNGSTILRRQQKTGEFEARKPAIMHFDPPLVKTTANREVTPNSGAPRHQMVTRRISDINLKGNQLLPVNSDNNMPEWKRQLIERKRAKMMIN